MASSNTNTNINIVNDNTNIIDFNNCMIEKSIQLIELYSKFLIEFNDREKHIFELINVFEIADKDIIVASIMRCIICIKYAINELELNLKLNNFDGIIDLISFCDRKLIIFKQTINILTGC